MGDASLNDLLKRYFGFDTFRPLQKEIIRTALEGRDAFVLMPTGGGKSLCVEIWAIVRVSQASEATRAIVDAGK